MTVVISVIAVEFLPNNGITVKHNRHVSQLPHKSKDKKSVKGNELFV